MYLNLMNEYLTQYLAICIYYKSFTLLCIQLWWDPDYILTGHTSSRNACSEFCTKLSQYLGYRTKNYVEACQCIFISRTHFLSRLEREREREREGGGEELSLYVIPRAITTADATLVWVGFESVSTRILHVISFIQWRILFNLIHFI